MSLLIVHAIQPLSTVSIFKGQMWDPAQNDQKFQIQWRFVTTCLPLMSPMFGHFLFPNFKRPIPSQKWIFKQQVRVPLNIPKQRRKITCQCTNPFHHLARATPKTTRKPFRGHGGRHRPGPPWPPQRSAAPHFRPKKLMEMFNPIRPNLHTPNNWHLRVYCHAGCGLAKECKVCAAMWQMMCSARRNAEIDSLYPVGWKTGAYTAWCPVKKYFAWYCSGSKKCLFLSKKMDKIEEAFALNMVSIWKYGWNWQIEILHCCYALCLKFPVRSIPISTPQPLAPQCLLAQQALPPCQGGWWKPENRKKHLFSLPKKMGVGVLSFAAVRYDFLRFAPSRSPSCHTSGSQTAELPQPILLGGHNMENRWAKNDFVNY